MSQRAWSDPAAFEPGAEFLPSALEAAIADAASAPQALLLLADAAARRDGWAADAALGIARALVSRGHAVVLVDLDFVGASLQRRLGVDRFEGIADVFLFGASLDQVVASVGTDLELVGTGAYVPEPATVLRQSRWSALISETAGAGKLLIAFAPAEAAGVDVLAGRIGSVVSLASSSGRDSAGAALPAGAAVIATVQPEPAGGGEYTAIEFEDLDEPRIDAERLDEPAFIPPPRPRRKRRAPAVAIGAAALALIAIAWFVARGAQSRPGADTGESQAGAGGEQPPAEEVAQPAPRPVETPIPFSVAIEAHQDLAIATQRVRALRAAEPGLAFYIAPVTVDGVVYYRVLGGPAQDIAAAQSLMQRLVDAGHKTAAEPWAIRPTAWAFHIGDFLTRDAALAREAELSAQGVPAYVVEIPYVAGPSRYRVYAGAYEGPAEAQVMSERLEDAGLTPRLVERTGQPAT